MRLEIALKRKLAQRECAVEAISHCGRGNVSSSHSEEGRDTVFERLKNTSHAADNTDKEVRQDEISQKKRQLGSLLVLETHRTLGRR